MNHPPGAHDGLVVVENFQLLHLYFAAFQRRVSAPRKLPRVDPRGVRRPTAGPHRASARLHFAPPPVLRSVQTLPGSPFSILGTPVRLPARRARSSGAAPARPAGTRYFLRG